jgi:tetratricopeptide (TPR) repeat protein
MSLCRGIKTSLVVLLLTVFSFSLNPVFAYNPEAVQLYNSAVDLSKNGNFQDSIILFKRAIAIDPNFTDAYYNLASIYEYMGNSSQALVNFEAVLKRNPDDTESAYKAAALCYKMKSYSKVQSYLHLISPDDPQYVEAQALSRRVKQEIDKINQAKIAQATSNSVTANQTVAPKNPAVSSHPVVKPVNKQVSVPVKPTDVEGTKTILKDFSGPTGIARDNKGNLYIANYTSNNIVQIAPDGTRTVFAKTPDVNGPVGLAIDSYNNIYVANYISNEVIRIMPDGRSNVILRAVNKPYYLYIDRSGILYVSEQGSNTVIKVKVI